MAMQPASSKPRRGKPPDASCRGAASCQAQQRTTARGCGRAFPPWQEPRGANIAAAPSTIAITGAAGSAMSLPSPAMILLSALVGCGDVAEARAFLEARPHPRAGEALSLLDTHAEGAELALSVRRTLGEGLPVLPPEEWAARYDRAVS